MMSCGQYHHTVFPSLIDKAEWELSKDESAGTFRDERTSRFFDEVSGKNTLFCDKVFHRVDVYILRGIFYKGIAVEKLQGAFERTLCIVQLTARLYRLCLWKCCDVVE